MEDETFHQVGTRIFGVVGVLLAALAVAVVVGDGLSRDDVAWASGFALLGVLAWASMVRPQLRLTRESVVLRNMLETVTVPVASVEDARVTRFLVLRAGGRRLVSTAVARSMGEIRGSIRNPGQDRDPEGYANLVEDRIRMRADDARARLGVRRGDAEADVRRALAWPEIALLAACAIGLAVGILL